MVLTALWPVSARSCASSYGMRTNISATRCKGFSETQGNEAMQVVNYIGTRLFPSAAFAIAF
jgi:hypothetical protein